MSEENDMKFIIGPLDGDERFPILTAVANGAYMGTQVQTAVGVGNRFWAFQSLPDAIRLADVLGASFEGAPMVSSNPVANQLAVDAMYADPPPVDSRTPTERGEDPPNGVVWAVE